MDRFGGRKAAADGGPLLAGLLAAYLCMIGGAMGETAGGRSSDVSIPGPEGPLRGTLEAPASGDPRAAVLILPGSGPTDRNGNAGPHYRTDLYRHLAGELAGRGVATLRIDKRGVGGSARAVADGNAVTLAGYASDAAGWAAFLARRTGRDCVWLLGHSEGGLVALKTAASTSAPVCGLMLLATPGRPVGDVLRTQLRRMSHGEVLQWALGAVDSLEQGRRVDTADMHPGLAPIFRDEVQDYLIDLLAHDPAAMLRAHAGPVLILQGEADVQVGADDARRLAEVRPDARLVMLPGVHHDMRTFDAAGPWRPDPDRGLDARVVAAISRFVLE